MRERVKALFGDWRFHLAWITILSVVLRSIPAWIYSGWGNDFGIYYSITIEFLDKKNPLYEYPAVWGSSGYGDFPVFYLIILGIYLVTGADPRTLVLRVPPVFGGLTVVPLFFISYYLTKRRSISLLAALLLAINPIHMYQTSMPYFLTVAHLFLLISIYFFIRWKDDSKWLYPLIPFSVILLLSHHLTTYIFIISMLGISISLSVVGKISYKTIKSYFLFISIFSAITFAYWVLRVKGMYSFLSSPYHGLLPWYVTPGLFFVLLAFLYRLSLRYRISPQDAIIERISRLKVSSVFALSLSLGILFFIALAIFELQGYNIQPTSVLYSIPFLATLGFMGVGLSRLYINRNVLYIVGGWLGAITVSAFAGIVAKSLIPWRHVEYMMEPLSIVGAIGILVVMESEVFSKVEIKRRIITLFNTPIHVITHIHSADMCGRLAHTYQMTGESPKGTVEYSIIYPLGKRMKVLFISIIVFIVVMTGITAFPLMGKVAPPAQEVSDVVMSAVVYLDEYGNRNYTVATSHKIGTLIAAYGFNSSFEYDYKIWNSTSWRDCLDELMGLNGTYPPIGYVIITREMFEDGVYGYGDLENPIAPPVMMTNESYEKFKREPFELIFENHTLTYDDWVEIYSVNWTYIYDHLNSSFNISDSKNGKMFYTPWNSHRDFLNFSISCSSEFRRSLFTSTPAIFIMNSSDFK